MENKEYLKPRLKAIISVILVIIVIISISYFCFLKPTNNKFIGTWSDSTSVIEFHNDKLFKFTKTMDSNKKLVINGTYKYDNTLLYLKYLYPSDSEDKKYLSFSYYYEIDNGTIKLRDINDIKNTILEYNINEK